MCSDWIIAVPGAVYIIGTLYMSALAFLNRGERPPGPLWQFDRRSYSEIGWRWHKRSMWMVAAAVPVVLTLSFIAKRICTD